MGAIGAVFQPELIELMKVVLDDATATLPEAKRTSTMKAEIASHILACAANGERNPATLKMAALSSVVECVRTIPTTSLRNAGQSERALVAPRWPRERVSCAMGSLGSILVRADRGATSRPRKPEMKEAANCGGLTAVARDEGPPFAPANLRSSP